MRNAEIRREIGARLVDERARLGLTQQGLASAINCSRLSVIQYESGRSSPAAETLVALESIGVDVRFLLTGLRAAPLGIDRDRFRVAFEESLRQAKARRERRSPEESLEQAWRIYDALTHLSSPVGRR